LQTEEKLEVRAVARLSLLKFIELCLDPRAELSKGHELVE